MKHVDPLIVKKKKSQSERKSLEVHSFTAELQPLKQFNPEIPLARKMCVCGALIKGF